MNEHKSSRGFIGRMKGRGKNGKKSSSSREKKITQKKVDGNRC
jgi:hypothetical protein